MFNDEIDNDEFSVSDKGILRKNKLNCPPNSGQTYNPRGLIGSILAGYVPLASQSPIIVYFVANYRPYLSHF